MNAVEKFVVPALLALPLAVASFTLPHLAGMLEPIERVGAATSLVERSPVAALADPPPVPGRRYSSLDESPPPTLAPFRYPNIAVAGVQSGKPSISVTPIPTATRTHTVERGDELRHLAERYGVTMQRILAANDIPDPDSLRVGQTLAILDPPR